MSFAPIEATPASPVVAKRGAALRDNLFRLNANSTARRTIYFACFLLPAFLSSSAMFFFATRLLSADHFGIFYFAYSIQNVGCAGSIIINIALTRHYSALVQRRGPSAVASAARAVERVALLWGPAMTVAAIVGLALLGDRLGAHAWIIAVLISVDIYVSYLCDLQRAAIQSLRKSNLLGTFILLHMVLRFAFSAALIVVVQTAWAGIAGWLAASVLSYLIFRPLVLRGSDEDATGARADLPPLRDIPALLLSYGLTTACCYLDVGMAYLLLPAEGLGIYSSSSVLPKMILSGATPILLMLLPFMVGQSRDIPFKALLRVAAMLLLLVGAALAFLYVAAPVACDGRWGFKYCRIDVFDGLLLSTIPLILMRILSFAAFAAARNWAPLLFAPALAAFAVAIGLEAHVTAATLARDYAYFSGGSILFYLAVARLTAQPRPRTA